MKEPFYLNPRFRWGAAILVLGILLIYLWFGSLQDLFRPFASLLNGQLPVFDADFVNAVLSFGLAVAAVVVTRRLFFQLVSQFALPVNTLGERRQAIKHFEIYSSGLPGPAIFIRDGQVVARAAERQQLTRAAGVILVDSASGVVLRTDTQLTRAHGPGVVFTRPGEYIAETLDLRRQSRSLKKVKGLTRDGIEVTVDIAVTFMLESGERRPFSNLHDATKPPFVFSEEHALKVGYGKTYRDNTLGEWAELPPLLAADIWRERLIQRDFESLFSSTDTGMTLLDGLQYQIQSRLMGTGPDEKARECRVLAERGIRVLGVSLSGLALPEDVQTKRLESWKDDWKSQAGEIPDDKDPTIKKWRQEGRQEGRIHVIALLTKFTREQLGAGQEPDIADVVLSLASGTRQLLRDPSLQDQQNIADLRNQIEDLEIWAQRLQNARPLPAEQE